MNNFQIPDGTGGINPGDRRALFYLVRRFNTFSVLEIGTHIGASTINIAAALKVNYQIEQVKNPILVSVDIHDVNDDIKKPWLKFNMKYSPLNMIEILAFSDFVHFMNSSSNKFFNDSDQKYQFKFLDGDHSAAAVYRDIHNALNSLNKDGIIVLHDYFPNMKSIWSNKSLIAGPYLAVKRIMKEQPNIVVLPLGELPWSTKYGSNRTSLALLLKND